MDIPTTSSAKQVAENSYGTRRNTRSTSNQDKEKENSENAKNSSANGKDQDSGSNDSAKKSPKERVVRAQNGDVLEYTTEDDITYRPLDSAYLTSERPDNPYFICTIQEIKVSKRDNAVVVVKWYYRPTEVPDLVYQMLVKDRINQIVDPDIKDLIMKPDVINRELFVADQETTDTYPISFLRGKCEVTQYTRITEIKGFELKPDHFFYIFGYNPETRRLASSKGETRVGPSHQWTASARGMFQKAQLPDVLKPDEQAYDRTYEDMTWEPKVNNCDLIMCLRAARSLAAFAGVCDGVSPEEGCIVASRDDTTINALRVLYENNGNPRKAIDALVKNPVPVTIESKWTEEQVKRFQRGLRLHGKDFFKIRKELLPMKETGELVEFYYLWKKTQDGLMIRPHHRKHRRQATMKKSNKHKSSNNTGSGDQTSTEEETEESEESEKEVNNFKCKHCLTSTSKDWLVGGKEGVMLCTDCRIFYKKYGENRPVVKVEDIDSANEADIDTPPAGSNQMPPFLFKPIKEEKMTNLIARKPAKSLAKVNSSSDLKKPNKRQWSDSEETAVKQEVLPAKLKRPKTEKEEVDNRLQTNQDGGARISSMSEMSMGTGEQKGISAPECKPYPSSISSSLPPSIIPGKNIHAFVTNSVPHSNTKTSVSADQSSASMTKCTTTHHLKSISSLCASNLTPFVPSVHGTYPGLTKTTSVGTKSELGLNNGIIPREGVFSTVAYFGSSSQPLLPTQSVTTGQHSASYSAAGTTTVSTAHTVRLSPTVDLGPRAPRAPEGRPTKPTEGSQAWVESPRPIADHNMIYRPVSQHLPPEQARQIGRPSPPSKAQDQYYRPTTIKEEVGLYRQPPHDTYRRNPRFPFDPCVTDQIISNANTLRTVAKEEGHKPSSPPHMGREHGRQPRPHLLPARGSPLPQNVKKEPHPHSGAGGQLGIPLYKASDRYTSRHEHHRDRQSPALHGPRPHSSTVRHPGQPYPPQHPISSRPQERTSPPRQSYPDASSSSGQAHPLERDDSDVELISATRPKTPPPTPVVEAYICHGNSARFRQVWNRGQNSCFRTDYIFFPDRNSVQKRLHQQEKVKKQQVQEQQAPAPTQQDQPGQTTHKHQRTPSHPRPHSDQEKKRDDKSDVIERGRREGPGPLSSSSLPPSAQRTTPSHGNVPRTTPTRTPTTLYDQHHRPPAALMSPFPIGGDLPALRTLQQYASYDTQRNAEAMNAMNQLYPYYLGERELRERELRERESRERFAKMGVDVKSADILDPHHSNMQQVPQSGLPGIPQGLHMAGIPATLSGPHLASVEQLQLRHYQALLASMPPGSTPHPALAAAAAAVLPPGAIPASPFAHPDAAYVERLSADRLHAERMAAAEQYQLELLHHHQHSHVHSHLHLHQPGQPGAPPPPGGPVPLNGLPPPPPGLAVVPDQLFSPYAAMQAAAMSPFAASASNPLLLSPAIRNQQASMQAALMHPSHLHAAAVAGREQGGQPHHLSASQHLQAVHEQHIIESTQRARAVAAFQEQQYMAARLAGHKP